MGKAVKLDEAPEEQQEEQVKMSLRSYLNLNTYTSAQRLRFKSMLKDDFKEMTLDEWDSWSAQYKG